jgi:hypothetical protein
MYKLRIFPAIPDDIEELAHILKAATSVYIASRAHVLVTP